MSWQLALQRIEEAKLNNAFYLYLNDLSLTQLPNEVIELEQLIFLDLSNNAFKEIPSLISNLPKLRYLNLNKNDIEILDLTYIENLRNLQKLFIADNRIKNIQGDFSNLENLIELSLAHNELEKLPHFSKPMKEIFTFNLSNNQFATFPFTDEERKELFGFYTNIVFDKNPKYEKNTPKNLQNALPASEICYEAKLVFVGMPGSGKTSLKKKLLNPEYMLTYEGSTEGIDVESWYFDFENTEQEKHKFRVNHWDFGGQEIYRATHQFFITKDTLYVLVIDPVKDRQIEDIDYWLRAIKSLSGKDSPVIIVKNKCDERTANIDEASIRKNFQENIVEIINTSAKTNEGVEELRQVIKNSLINKLKSKRTVHTKWISIRNDLESSGYDYIAYEEFKDRCALFGVTLPEEIEQISEYYHNLGLFIHFLDNVYLRDTLILNPRWGTAAFYNIYDSPEVKDNNGKFKRHNLKTIWRRHKIKQGERENTPEFPEHLHNFLLDLILRFELCYRIPNNDEFGEVFILPDLLPPNPLYLDFDLIGFDKDPIIFKIEYKDFFPSGIMYRLIIRLHEYIYENKQWQYGVYLYFDNSYGELILDSINKTIYIKTFGSKKRFLFEEIYNAIRFINTKFFNLDENNFIESVPCSCDNIKIENRCSFKLSSLIKRNKQGITHIDCLNDESPKNTVISSLSKVGKYELYTRDIKDVKSYYANHYQNFFSENPALFIDSFSSQKYIDLFFEHLLDVKEKKITDFADNYLSILERYAFKPMSENDFDNEVIKFFHDYENYLKVTLILTENNNFKGVDKKMILGIYDDFLKLDTSHPFYKTLQLSRGIRNYVHHTPSVGLLTEHKEDSKLLEQISKMDGRSRLKNGISSIFNVFLLVANDYVKKFGFPEDYTFKNKSSIKSTTATTILHTEKVVVTKPKIEKGEIVECELKKFHDSGQGITVTILGCKERGTIHIGELANKFIADIHEFEYNGEKLEEGIKIKAKIIDITDKGIQLSIKQV